VGKYNRQVSRGEIREDPTRERWNDSISVNIAFAVNLRSCEQTGKGKGAKDHLGLFGGFKGKGKGKRHRVNRKTLKKKRDKRVEQ